jgi:hypothetical protein
MKPLCIDLFCGLGGWAEGFLSEGYWVIGFDIEKHDYGFGSYPGQLVLQDVLTLHGSQFKDAAVIVASPPCQKYSYMAMPWKKAKELIRYYEASAERRAELTAMFDACFRIQREASEAAGRHIPLIVENVRGAQRWVGRAKWNFGPFYLWGDVPALMPTAFRIQKFNPDGTAHGQGSWFAISNSKNRGVGQNLDGRKIKESCSPRRWEDLEVKRLRDADNFGWRGSIMREGTSHGTKRKAASAQIAKIPFPLAQHIARVYKPVDTLMYA